MPRINLDIYSRESSTEIPSTLKMVCVPSATEFTIQAISPAIGSHRNFRVYFKDQSGKIQAVTVNQNGRAAGWMVRNAVTSRIPEGVTLARRAGLTERYSDSRYILIDGRPRAYVSTLSYSVANPYTVTTNREANEFLQLIENREWEITEELPRWATYENLLRIRERFALPLRI